MRIYPVIHINLVSDEAGTTTRLHWADKTLPSQAEAPHAGCHACIQSLAGPSCHAIEPAQPSLPRLVGPTGELHRLLAALAPRLGFDLQSISVAGTSLVRGLAVLPGEVTLELAVGRHCGGQGLIDTAFQTLRALLPDSDIYVNHAD